MEHLGINWTVEKRKVADLKLWGKNPRKITPEHYDRLKERIKARGMHDVLKIDIDNTVLSGNQRKVALDELGVLEVFVMVPERKLTEEERDKVGLESNMNDGSQDYKILGENFDADLLKSIGYTANEIDLAFDLKTGEVPPGDSGETPTAQPGDIYQLGQHRLMCGDSTDPLVVASLMDGKKANLIFTDPPYMVDYKAVKSGNTYSSEKYGGAGNKVSNDNLDDEKAFAFFVAVLKNLSEASEDNAPIYWWYAGKNVLINRLAWEEAGYYMSQIVIWLKNSMVYSRGQDFHRCYEPCMFGWKKGKTHYINRQVADLKDVWTAMDVAEFQDQLDIWYAKRDPTADYIHPTQKPVQLAERALRKSSKQNDIVLDLFGGSGSTLIACEQMKRRAYLMELDPKFVDAIINRWETLTGEKAKKL